MELEKTFALRRSTRGFTDEQISAQQLEALLTAAQTAPYAMGDAETTHITVVQDAEVLEKLRKACEMKAKSGKTLDAFYGAQTMFFISATDISDDHIEYCNVACIIENILLQATALGLGSVYIWGCLKKLRANHEALGLLNLPEGYEILSAVAVGHSEKPLEPRDPKETFSVNLI